MRVGVTSDTTCLGDIPTKVSDIKVEEASYTFPTYEVQTGPCGMELEIPLLQNIQSNQGSNPQASLPNIMKIYLNRPLMTQIFSLGTSKDIPMINIKFYRTFISSWLKKPNIHKIKTFASINTKGTERKEKETLK